MARFITTVLCMTMLLLLNAPDFTAAQQQDRQRIYGSQLMTEQERNEYHHQLRLLKTEQERERFRLEHHRKMRERAQKLGETLPEEPHDGNEKGFGVGSQKRSGGGGNR